MAAADRRTAILAAARLAFAEGAYHEVSLDSVAERAGVSKALLYEHFDSKRELYQAMLEMHTARPGRPHRHRRRRPPSRASPACWQG